MGRLIDDSVKQKLLDSLAEEPPMVISTAYAYAKNYVEYGEDITKAWTTAVQQASIIAQIKIKAQAEAYDSFKKEYENRLNVDMIAMLEELKAKIEELNHKGINCYRDGYTPYSEGLDDCKDIIQQEINSLKEAQNDRKENI